MKTSNLRRYHLDESGDVSNWLLQTMAFSHFFRLVVSYRFLNLGRRPLSVAVRLIVQLDSPFNGRPCRFGRSFKDGMFRMCSRSNVGMLTKRRNLKLKKKISNFLIGGNWWTVRFLTDCRYCDYCYYKFRPVIKRNWWRFPRQWPAAAYLSLSPVGRRVIHGNGHSR